MAVRCSRPQHSSSGTTTRPERYSLIASAHQDFVSRLQQRSSQVAEHAEKYSPEHAVQVDVNKLQHALRMYAFQMIKANNTQMLTVPAGSTLRPQAAQSPPTWQISHHAETAASILETSTTLSAPKPFRPWEMQASATAPAKVDESSPPLVPTSINGQGHFYHFALSHYQPQTKEITNKTPDEKELRVTIYNPQEGRKLSGNAAPLSRNIKAYLASHPNWELYAGQDLGPSGKKRQRTLDTADRLSGGSEVMKQRKLESRIHREQELKINRGHTMSSLLWAIGQTSAQTAGA